VDVVVHDQLVLAEGRVDLGELADGVDDGPADEGQVGEAEALVGLEPGALGPPHLLDRLVVDLDRRVDVGRGLLRADHVLGGAPADVAVRDDRVPLPRPGRRGLRRGGCGRGRRRLRGGGRGGGRGGRLGGGPAIEHGQHVVAGDAAAGARARDLRRVEAVLPDQAPDDRRQQPPLAVGARRPAGGRRLLGRRRRGGRGPRLLGRGRGRCRLRPGRGGRGRGGRGGGGRRLLGGGRGRCGLRLGRGGRGRCGRRGGLGLLLGRGGGGLGAVGRRRLRRGLGGLGRLGRRRRLGGRAPAVAGG